MSYAYLRSLFFQDSCYFPFFFSFFINIFETVQVSVLCLYVGGTLQMNVPVFFPRRICNSLFCLINACVDLLCQNKKLCTFRNEQDLLCRICCLGSSFENSALTAVFVTPQWPHKKCTTSIKIIELETELKTELLLTNQVY